MSVEAVAMTGLTIANPALAAGLTVAQGYVAIQNARYQADLIKAQDREQQRRAAFAQTQIEIEAEQERLNRAIAKRDKLRQARRVMGENVANEASMGVRIEGDVMEIVSLRNLSEELNAITLEEAIITQRLKGQGAEIAAKSMFDTRVSEATADMVLTAGYLQAAGSAVSAYQIGANAGWFDNINLGSTMSQQVKIMGQVGKVGLDKRVIP